MKQKRGKEGRLAEDESGDFFVFILSVSFSGLFLCVVFQVYESGLSVGVCAEKTLGE